MGKQEKMYYLYHIPGKKIGVTSDIYNRVEKIQGYKKGSYQILYQSTDIDFISKKEKSLQKHFGYSEDLTNFKECFNKRGMKDITSSENTTTIPVPIPKLKGYLMDNIGKEFSIPGYGDFKIERDHVDWYLKNCQPSQFRYNECYFYNEKFFNSLYAPEKNSSTTEYVDSETIKKEYYEQDATIGNIVEYAIKEVEKKFNCRCGNTYTYNHNGDDYHVFDLIRTWANERGLYNKGDVKTQLVKLSEEMGEVARAIIKNNDKELKDGIGDMVVVLTNLAHLAGFEIEDCIWDAYNEIKNRKGSMKNGSFVKEEPSLTPRGMKITSDKPNFKTL